MTTSVGSWAASVRASALVGTSRRPAGAVPPGLVDAPDGVEHSLLDQAALLDVLDRAGAVPTSGEPVEAAPPNRRPDAPAAAVQLLTLLLRQSPLSANARDRQVDHWLARCASADYSAPAELLPELVAMARQRKSMRGVLAEVWDERGRWYAEHRASHLLKDDPASADAALADNSPTARPGAEAGSSSAAEGGVPAEIARLSLDWTTQTADIAGYRLGRIRSLDAAAGRELLVAHWGKYSAKDRARLLEALKAGLSAADEPFLEEALDDRAQSVREVAIALLTRLPDSALVGRMGRRLVPLVGVTKRFLRDPLVSVEPPITVDDAAVRDGLAKPNKSGDQPRGQWLDAIVAAAPLETWHEITGLPPETIVRLLATDPLVSGALLKAVRLRRDPEWAVVLTASGRHGDLVGLLPVERQTTWLSEALAAGPAEPRSFLQALRDAPRPWPVPLANAVAERLARSDDADLFVRGFGEDLHPGFGADAVALLERLDPPEANTQARRILIAVRQNIAFARSIDEAFPPRRNPA